MTIFISDNTPKQPTFLFATYPPGTTVADSPESAAYAPADVLQADETNGWRPVGTNGAHALIVSYPQPVQVEYFALVGKYIDGVTLEIRGSLDGFVASDVQLLPPVPLFGTVAAWGSFPASSWLTLKYIFSSFSSDFMVKHIAAGTLALLPFMDDGFCAAPLQSEGDHLISHSGLFLGSTTARVMRPFSLSFGQVTPVEEAMFSTVMASCLRTAQGLFFVPDTSLPEVHFGWLDKKYKYEPRMKNGSYEISPIPFTTRAI